MPVNLFDANHYRSVNSNLRGLSDADTLSHFRTIGLSQDLKFSSVIDLSFYRARNSDLTNFTNQQLFDHLANQGIAEGRTFSKVFDLKFYQENNNGLAGLNNEQLFSHYISKGLREGWNGSPYITDDAVSDRFKSASSVIVSSNPVIFRESVGDNDLCDMYKIQLDLPSTNLNLVLNGLSADADLELLDRKGNLLSSSKNTGNASESISYDNLNSGIYFVRVSQASVGQNTNYNLSVSSTLISNQTTAFISQPVIPIAEIAPASATTSQPVIPIAEVAPASVTTNSFLNEVVNLINAERANANKGLQPLRLSEKLNQIAYSHSKDMALNDYFSHTGIDGSSPQTRAAKAGYQYSRFGENIAAGYTTPQEVVEAWMNSQGHRANILSPHYQEVGIGYYYLANDTGKVNYYDYWTQNFGTPF
ncbi:MAG: pre-peptidase C-terminal domain-containing protein [Calothrix sp. C42_A2020_038]|nr:pre-peptidase C-terminal domain-containing protein [Calothrix sp. C42_A2020_038]